MFSFLRQQRHDTFRATHTIPDTHWQSVTDWPLLRGMNAEDITLLREQAAWFLQRSAITPVAGLKLDDMQRLQLAVQAVLPVLNLGFDALDKLHELVIYPTAFRVRDMQREMLDGHLEIEHEMIDELAGQARPNGVVLLSWEDADISPWLDGWNVVIHEIAHQLDMRNGDANGCPPLHGNMNHGDWKAAFEPAFADLLERAETDEDSEFDLYAATDPAECFAVCSEYFFELPHVLIAQYPAVYEQLRLFYRQDPASRLAPMRYRPILPEMRDLYAKELF